MTKFIAFMSLLASISTAHAQVSTNDLKDQCIAKLKSTLGVSQENPTLKFQGAVHFGDIQRSCEVQVALKGDQNSFATVFISTAYEDISRKIHTGIYGSLEELDGAELQISDCSQRGPEFLLDFKQQSRETSTKYKKFKASFTILQGQISSISTEVTEFFGWFKGGWTNRLNCRK